MKTIITKLERQGLTRDEIISLTGLTKDEVIKYKAQGRPVFLENGALELSAINSLKSDNRIEVIEKARLYDKVFNTELYEGMSLQDKANIMDELPTFLQDIETRRIEKQIRLLKEEIFKYESQIVELNNKIADCHGEIDKLNSKLLYNDMSKKEEETAKQIATEIATQEEIIPTSIEEEVLPTVEEPKKVKRTLPNRTKEYPEVVESWIGSDVKTFPSYCFTVTNKAKNGNLQVSLGAYLTKMIRVGENIDLEGYGIYKVSIIHPNRTVGLKKILDI